MFKFKKEIINGSFNKANKISKNADCININVKSNDKNVEIRCTGKGIWAAGIIAVAPTLVCVLSATASACVITKIISKRKKSKENEQNLIK